MKFENVTVYNFDSYEKRIEKLFHGDIEVITPKDSDSIVIVKHDDEFITAPAAIYLPGKISNWDAMNEEDVHKFGSADAYVEDYYLEKHVNEKINEYPAFLLCDAPLHDVDNVIDGVVGIVNGDEGVIFHTPERVFLSFIDSWVNDQYIITMTESGWIVSADEPNFVILLKATIKDLKEKYGDELEKIFDNYDSGEDLYKAIVEWVYNTIGESCADEDDMYEVDYELVPVEEEPSPFKMYWVDENNNLIPIGSQPTKLEEKSRRKKDCWFLKYGYDIHNIPHRPLHDYNADNPDVTYEGDFTAEFETLEDFLIWLRRTGVEVEGFFFDFWAAWVVAAVVSAFTGKKVLIMFGN